MVSTKENELSDLTAIALDVYIETNKNKQNQGKNEQKREIKKDIKQKFLTTITLQALNMQYMLIKINQMKLFLHLQEQTFLAKEKRREIRILKTTLICS